MATTDTKGITHEHAKADPERYRILDNGAVYDLEIKRIVGNPGGGATAITKETAKALAETRWEKSRAAFAEGFVTGTPGLTARDADIDAWKAIGEKTAELIHGARSLRGYTEAVNMAAKQLGFEQPVHAQAMADASTHALAELAGRLLDMVDRAMPARDIVDAETHDI